MKATLPIAACLLGSLAATGSLQAQGLVEFSNNPWTLISNAVTGQLIFGTNLFLFGLYVGPEGSTAPQLTLLATVPNATSASSTDPVAGRFAGYSVAVPGADAQTPISVQVRAWSQSAGGSYEAAYAAALAGNQNILLGESGLGVVFPGLPPGSAAQLFLPLGPLSGFSVGPIPEPSTAALGVAGSVVFLWFLGRGRARRCYAEPSSEDV